MKALTTSYRAAAMLSVLALSSLSGRAADPAAAPAITVSHETTYFTAPLQTDGRVDLLAAFNEKLREGVTVENNAAIVLWQAIGPGPIEASLRPSFFKLLGTDELPLEGNYFVSYLEYFLNKGTPIEGGDEERRKTLLPLRTRPWKAADRPRIAEWLAAISPSLDKLVAATSRPRMYEPIVLGRDELLLDFTLPAQELRSELAEALALRAMSFLAQEKLNEAWRDILAIHRFARLTGEGPSYNNWYIAAQVQEIGYGCTEAWVAASFPDLDRAKRCARDLAAIPRLPEFTSSVDLCSRMELLQSATHWQQRGLSKARTIDSVATAANGVPDELLDAVGKRVDWNLVLKRCNKLINRVVAAHGKATHFEQSEELYPIIEELADLEDRASSGLMTAMLLNSADGLTRWTGDVLISNPGLLATVFRDSNETDVRSDILALVFTLEAYRAEHNRYPAELSDLAPFYIAKIPNDRYGDEPLRYARQNDGYVLYSVGKNISDDGGLSRPDDLTVDQDDIAIRVSGGKSGE